MSRNHSFFMRQSTARRLGWQALLGSTLLFLLLSSCSGPAERLWLKAPAWNRAALVGNTQVGDPVPLALDDAGRIYLLLINRGAEASRPMVVAMDRQANVLWEQMIDIALVQPDKPRLLWDGEAIRLFWISDHELFTAQMDTKGDLVSAPERISGDVFVDDYDVRQLRGQELSVWFAGPRRQPGVYALKLGGSQQEATLVDPEGSKPTLQLDTAGTLHALWSRRPTGYGGAIFLYAAYPSGEYQPGRETVVFDLTVGPTIGLFGPFLGIDEERVYIFWTVRFSAGLQAGTTLTRFTHFPLGEPESIARIQDLRVPTSSKLDYEDLASASLKGGPRVVLGSGRYPTSAALSGLRTNPVQSPELALAFQMRVEHLYRDSEGQVSTVFLQDGAPTSYQLLSFTASASTAPLILSDEQGYLYVTWLEKRDEPGFSVYLASTDPEMSAALGSLTSDDLGRLGGEITFGLLTGALLAPIAAMIWLVPPLIVLGITSLIRREGRGAISLGTAVSLLLTLSVYWWVKWLSLPGMRTYVPFSAWLPSIPAWLGPALQWGVPILIGIISAAVAWFFTFGRQNKSAIYFLLIYVAVDGPLTMAIYGVLFYAAI